MKLASAVFLAGMAMSEVLMAQTSEPLLRWEIGGSLGLAEQSLSYSRLDTKIDEQDMGASLFATYYFTSMVAVRLGYADLGEVTWYDESYYDYYNHANIDELSASSSVSAVTLGAMFIHPQGKIPVTFALEMGAVGWTVDFDTVDRRTPDGGSTVRVDESFSTSDVGFYGGFHLGYAITPSFYLGMSAMWYPMTPEINGNDDFDLVVQTLNLESAIRF